ncbi:MAG: hypothetical protein J0I98_08910 [Mesorhizobium sp.]|nr:hypothetical protein [Mesorhizobium sp.]MBN9242900.1 hypothetical protein [Mesorhizobium sp.]
MREKKKPCFRRSRQSGNALGKISCAILASALAGCATTGSPAGPAAYADATCADLNATVGATSKDISAAAIGRGRIDRYNVPFWVPGGQRAITALKDRQSRRIDTLEDSLAAQIAARRGRCSGP